MQRRRPGRRSSATASASCSARSAGVFIAVALVAAIVVADRSGDAGERRRAWPPNWSRWQPSDTTLEGGAQQIAEHVGAEYKHPDGKQLVLIKAAGCPLEIDVALRPSHRRRSPSIDGNTACSTRSTGSARTARSRAASRPTTRLKVIHREALELALYTFRYLPDAEIGDDAAAAAAARPRTRSRPPRVAAAAGQRPTPKPLTGALLPPGRPQAAAAGAARRRRSRPKAPSTGHVRRAPRPRRSSTLDALEPASSGRSQTADSGRPYLVLDRP